MTYLVFGDGLLGNSFKILNNALVLSKSQCDITDKDAVYEVIKRYKPLVVINAAGIVPRSTESTETMFKVNSFAPHSIADICRKRNVNISIFLLIVCFVGIGGDILNEINQMQQTCTECQKYLVNLILV